MEKLENDNFLSISKAIEIFDTSYSSVQRLCRKEKNSKRVKKKSNKYIIQYSLLSEHFKLLERPQKQGTSKQGTPTHVEKDEPNLDSQKVFIESLNSQIDFLKIQMTNKDNQIDKLLQRQSEQNIIIQTLQTSLSNKIDSSVPLLVDTMKETRPHTTPTPPNNDNGFTIAAAVLILLTVALLILFVTK